MRHLPALGLACLLAIPAAQAGAQTPANCSFGTLGDPPRRVLACSNGVTMEIEAAAAFGFADAASGRFDLEGGAALIEVEPGNGHLEIRTPHAIAAVRGTVYAVDVTAGGTAVFVQRGAVEVQSQSDRMKRVTLQAGEGVDVSPGGALSVKTWGAGRVSGLMARFGR